MFKHSEQQEKEAAQLAKTDINVSSEGIVKKSTKDLNMEGGSRINRQDNESLKHVNENLKRLSTADASKLHENVQKQLHTKENEDYLKYIEDALK